MCQYSLELKTEVPLKLGLDLVVCELPAFHGGTVLGFGLRKQHNPICSAGVCLKNDWKLSFQLSAEQVEDLGLMVGDESGATLFGTFCEADIRDPRARDVIEFEVGNDLSIPVIFDERLLGARAKVEFYPGEIRSINRTARPGVAARATEPVMV